MMWVVPLLAISFPSPIILNQTRTVFPSPVPIVTTIVVESIFENGDVVTALAKIV